MNDADLMAVLNRRTAELGGVRQITIVQARYAPVGAHPKHIPVEQRAAFVEEVLALKREEPAAAVAVHAARLVDAVVRVAIELAEMRCPIRKTFVPGTTLTRLAAELSGWQPTRAQVLAACWEAVPARLAQRRKRDVGALPLGRSTMPLAIRIDLAHKEALGEIMGEIRAWLDHQKIQPTGFQSAAAPIGLTVDVTFGSEQEAERFRKRFVRPLEHTSTYEHPMLVSNVAED